MKTYLREQSAREILGNTFEIYGRYVVLLFVTHLMITFPFSVWSSYVQETEGTMLNAGFYASMLVELVPSMAIAVAVSDICLGNRPSVLRSYVRVFGRRFGGMVATYLMVLAGLIASFLLFVIPALFFYAWYMFALVVVVLEGVSGRRALARSKALGKGFYARNLGLVALLFLMLIVFIVIALLIYDGLAAAFPVLAGPWPKSVFAALSGSLLSPLLYVGGVLLYYDMRVRKDAYDNTALTEDLLR